MAMGSLRRLARCDRGAAAIEFAIIAWVLIIVCLGVIEFGRGLHVRNEMASAGDRAARMILTNPAVTDGALTVRVREAFISPKPELLAVTFGTETANGIAFRTMLIQYPFSLLIPGLSDTITLTVSRRVPIG
jgi:Flp pilus assembly protein TadG